MIKIGWLFYKNGEVFLMDLFQNNSRLVNSINNLSLIGYYLTNIGYAIITIAYWKEINSTIELMQSLTTTLGKIIFGLAILHYNNIFWLQKLQKKSILN